MQVYYSEAQDGHDPSGFIRAGQREASPECPERAARLLAGIRKAGFAVAAPRSFGRAPVEAVHDPDYLNFLEHGLEDWRKLRGAGPEIIPNMHPGRHMQGRPQHIVGRAGWFMADTACPLGAGTFAAASAAADVALTAASAVLDGAPHAYALCRPPGHHAFSDMAGGFCFINNVAVAAQHAAERLGRVAILDVDVHHGNGTQQIFYDRDDVLFCSLHADPATFYPFFAGYAGERGRGAGEGSNLNLPLPAGTGDDAFLDSLDTGLAAIRRFSPRLLLISLGLDAQEHDPLGILSITTAGFGRIGERIAGLGLPTVIVQEGGYICDELGDNLASFLTGFAGAHHLR